MKNNDLSTPVSATAMGAGRVQAFASATATSIAYPSSLSFGLAQTPGVWSDTKAFWVENDDSVVAPLRTWPPAPGTRTSIRRSPTRPLSTDGSTFSGSASVHARRPANASACGCG